MLPFGAFKLASVQAPGKDEDWLSDTFSKVAFCRQISMCSFVAALSTSCFAETVVLQKDQIGVQTGAPAHIYCENRSNNNGHEMEVDIRGIICTLTMSIMVL